MLSKPSRQRGYALPETLIAAAIAAGVLTATASAMGGLIRLDGAATERARALQDVAIIAARVRAGMNDAQVLEGFDGWRLERAPFAGEAANANAPFERVLVSSDEDRPALELLAPVRERP